MLGGDLKMAIASLRSVKWRSLLTLLGIIIGVVSVVTIFSLGQGVKQEVSSQLNRAGPDLITVRPGPLPKGDLDHLTRGIGFGAGSLSERDFTAVQSTPSVRAATPLNFLAAGARSDEHGYNAGFVVGTNEHFAEIINQEVAFGSFYGAGELNRHVAVIGKTVAEELFNQNIPIGRTLTIHGQDFVVRGIFDNFEPNALALGMDFDKAIVVPYNTSKTLNNDAAQIVQVVAKPKNPNNLAGTIKAIQTRLLSSHGGQDDFSVLDQRQNLELNNRILSRLTGVIGAIAAIALLVAGIGIMNITLVSVTERTREIGIRKALGATNRQILRQFLIEAITLSVTGGVLGMLGAVVANYALRIFTNLQPIISLSVVLIAGIVSIVVGVAFGVVPAYKAARKDPIEALRYDL